MSARHETGPILGYHRLPAEGRDLGTPYGDLHKLTPPSNYADYQTNKFSAVRLQRP